MISENSRHAKSVTLFIQAYLMMGWSFGVISLCDILGKSKDSNERGVFWNGK